MGLTILTFINYVTMKIYHIIVFGGRYEDYYERDYLFSTEEKAKEFAENYRTSDEAWETEGISYKEVEIDSNNPCSSYKSLYLKYKDRYTIPRESEQVIDKPKWITGQEYYYTR